jgi:pimeloyl-ACP methyl ester carboxylesterase
MRITVDGQPVFAADYGRQNAPEPERPDIVFIHGAGMDHSVWTLQARWFAWHGWNALALDLPGHGRSAGEPLPTIEAAAAWLGRFLETAGMARAWLVGHSMGALIALEAAAEATEKVAGLVLLGAAARMPVHAALLAAAAHAPKLAAALIASWGYGARGHMGGNRAPGMWMLEAGRRLLERARPGVLHTDLAACNAYEGGEAAAAGIRCPTLVLIGRDDRMTPAREGRRLAGLIAGARTVELADCGHMPMAEQPDAVLDALREFIR